MCTKSYENYECGHDIATPAKDAVCELHFRYGLCREGYREATEFYFGSCPTCEEKELVKAIAAARVQEDEVKRQAEDTKRDTQMTGA